MVCGLDPLFGRIEATSGLEVLPFSRSTFCALRAEPPLSNHPVPNLPRAEGPQHHSLDFGCAQTRSMWRAEVLAYRLLIACDGFKFVGHSVHPAWMHFSRVRACRSSWQGLLHGRSPSDRQAWPIPPPGSVG